MRFGYRGERTAITMKTLSIVIIGYNEGTNLPACFWSIHDAGAVSGYVVETIYVDGGSGDDSLEIARRSGLDRILGGDTRRRAAENRNLGLEHAGGRLVHFLDGDMILDPEWLAMAVQFLDGNDDIASVCGNIEERNRSVYSRALEIDWGVREGPVRHCGGAALWRTEVLRQLGGFPLDVEYGEEPYLCWRVRNELSFRVYQLDRRMVTHDLGHVSFRDYWKRTVRSGRTYAEISTRLKDTNDPLWRRETRRNYAWALILVVLVAGTVIPFGDMAINLTFLAVFFAVFFAVLARKALAAARIARDTRVAVVYSLHTYFSKILLAIGQLAWHISSLHKLLMHKVFRS